ncbi:IclR family transcriptional regulator [Arthrobacter crystallopoietes BAB-32]|uniref:IclR family transcriptional regulator n=2 Tax=Crystallibacter crystallopoietes TaxID=37928 RepID=N1UYP1_9MICC|nr:IclR family transcriptional regulator [Arthrobacter crystallopoietes BAB-32]
MLARIAAILDAVEGSAASASELARRSGLSVSTAHRLALSLVEYGFLRRTQGGDFQLGHRFVRTALENAALPVLTRLRDETGETAQLWLRRGDDRICALSVDSQQELKATLPVGARVALPAGSSGGILARVPEALEELERHGWVESVAKRTPGLGSVSVPVESGGQLIAAVCLAVPLTRVQASPGKDFGEQVRAAAERIGSELDSSGQG